VNAFKQAFSKQDKTVGLVLKTMNTNLDSQEWREFLNICKQDDRITILTKTIDRADVLGLIDVCDCYISLHRAEGFGRTIYEAILLNKPIIATNYSGNIDFMSKTHMAVEYSMVKVKVDQYQWIESSDDAYWANPIIDSAVKFMRLKPYNKEKGKNFISPNAVSKIIKNYLQ
jgi:hypothetical protein